MGSGTKLFPQRSQTAYDLYNQELSDSIRGTFRILDPSYALGQDTAVYLKLMRDPVVAHALRFRKHLVAGPEWRIEPASDSEVDEAAAGTVEELVGNIRGFTDSRICLSESIFRGSAYARIMGRRRFATVNGRGPFFWWIPDRLIDVDRRRFQLVRARDGVLVWEFYSAARRVWEPLERPELFVRSVFDLTEDSLGYGKGLVDTLYYYASLKTRLVQDGARAAERFGQGFIKVAIENLRKEGRPPGRDADKTAKDWLDAIDRAAARNGFAHDKRDEVDILQGIGEGWQLIKELLGYLDNAIVTAVLGATLPTLESGGGSFAMARVQENSTEALVQADRKRLGEDLTRDLVGLVWRMNRMQFVDAGLSEARMPKLTIVQQKREDPAVLSQVIATLLQAGIPLKREEVYSKTGFSVPLERDETIEGLPPGAAGQAPPTGLPFKANGHGKRFELTGGN